jgi:acetyl-CoA carboxylase biotin carboxyl carrier protein
MGSSLKEYAEVFKELGLTELTVEEGNLKLVLKKEASVSQSNFAETSSAPVKKEEPEIESVATDVLSGTPVKSPLLGVFYGNANGRTLQVGDEVKEGDVLCTLEAMKMMNDVKSPVSGKVVKVGAKEGDLVEFDQVLFVIG